MPTDYGQLPKIIRYYALVFRQIISKFAFWKWSKILLKQNFDISKYRNFDISKFSSLFLLRWSALAVVVILLISLVFPLSSLAAFNQQINYQAKLTTTAGSTVPDDARSTVFSLYTASSGGTAIWTETQSVTTTDGLFSVMLGAVLSVLAILNAVVFTFPKKSVQLILHEWCPSEKFCMVKFSLVFFVIEVDVLFMVLFIIMLQFETIENWSVTL